MNNLKAILQAGNIREVVIVDDANDIVPTAKDLAADTIKWQQFIEDIKEEDEKQLESIYPRYNELRADELPDQDEFIALLWRERTRLRQTLITPLLERYQGDKDQDLRYIKTLTDILDKEDIRHELVGRAFEQKALTADLVIIDLFMGSAQDEESYLFTINSLKRVIERRPSNPPLVLLMSRSGRLEAKRKEFRDGVGLFESGFRIIRKVELAEDGKLGRTLTRLATHYSDSLKLAVFLNAWKTGLGRACSRTADLIRTLDLPDYAQIQQLLLADEEEPTGNYLVDVFDRVLLHEIEREAGIIDAAIGLNSLSITTYPPPYVVGSKDLQALVYRSIFQNNERLRLVSHAGSPVGFGDVLRRKPAHPAPSPAQVTEPAAADAGPPPPTHPLAGIGADDVVVVMTPACDLQHALTKRCLLLKGTLVPLKPENWTYKSDPIRTPVYEVTPDERYMIKWDMKDFETISHADLKAVLAAPMGFQVVARLREAQALELQQKLLSTFGRVGLLNPLPGTFAVKVEAYLPDLEKKLFKLTIPALAEHPAVTITGRKANKSAVSLVLCEDVCEAICSFIQTLDLATIHPGTRALIAELRSTGELLMLERGADITDLKDSGFKDIISSRPAIGEQPAISRTIALVRRRGSWIEEPLNNSFVGKAGVILVVAE